jgi:hypothetical protein
MEIINERAAVASAVIPGTPMYKFGVAPGGLPWMSADYAAPEIPLKDQELDL